MVARTILATLSGSGPHQRIEVGLVRRPDGRLAVDLCEQHHAEGIGWFDQRSMALDPRQLRQLVAALDLKGLALDAAVGADEAPATLPFPGPADREIRRPAIGD